MRSPKIVTVVAAATLLTACTATEEGDGNAQPDLLATTGVWADVAAAVTGADVDAVITGTDVDPHHFEPTAQDLAKVKAADTLVANGGGYDRSLYSVAEQDKVVFAIPPAEDGTEHDHHHSHGTEDLDSIEHIWFNPGKVREVAREVAQRTGGSAADVEARMDAVEAKLAEIGSVRLAATEPIATGLIYGTELHDVTPDGYLHAALNESEPSAQDIAAFLETIEAGELDLLVYNPQSTTSAADRIVEAAREHGVDVVEISEIPPAGTNFLDYMDSVVDQIAQAAAHY
mgnify:FL=1